MLHPNESKRDWLLFHMTPAGLARETPKRSGHVQHIAWILLGGLLAIGVLLAVYANA